MENCQVAERAIGYGQVVKRESSAAERMLLPAALMIAVLFDRLIFTPLSQFEGIQTIRTLGGLFWLCYLIIFYASYWKRLSRDKALWFVAGCTAALCAWNFIFRVGNAEYGLLTYLVIPTVLMAHAQLTAGGYKLKDAGSIAAAWLSGWFVKPFSGRPAMYMAIGSLVTGGVRQTAKRVTHGALAALLLLCVIVPLLCSADRVFGYYLGRIVEGWNIFSLVEHMVVVTLMFALFYSFLWNVGFGTEERLFVTIKTPLTIDTAVCGIVLSSVTLVYLLFCVIQFTYLFAGAGLPGGMTYSAYAREGFAQTVAVCAINLMIFGVFLHFGVRNKFITGLLAGLLGLTCVMLLSGFVRLSLYIDVYGLTWRRLLSAWFITYLAAVVLLCAVRMLRKELPLIALCMILLLGWYVALGYSNPDTFIARHNRSRSVDVMQHQ